jgi:hypothetical protein
MERSGQASRALIEGTPKPAVDGDPIESVSIRTFRHNQRNTRMNQSAPTPSTAAKAERRVR